jgi:hypothetical protein
MFCRLTLIGLMICLAASLAHGQTKPKSPLARGRNAAHAAVLSVDWNRLPFGDAVARLRSVATVDVFVDRRVDPDQPVDLSLENARVDEIIARLATSQELGHARLGTLNYIGPATVSDRLVALAALRRREVAQLPQDKKTSLTERRRIVWPTLTEPRGLVARLIEEHGWQVVGAEQIPHDLWGAGELPPMALADQLTLLLAGFDCSYRFLGDEQAIEIVPIDWKSIAPAKRTAAGQTRPAAAAPAAGRQVFTLRIENQPVGRVLEQLGQRLGWRLSIDSDALRAAGRSLDTRVSFQVENADEDQLLAAVVTPAGLKAERDVKTVRITPR